jgi:hypothetical protein
MKSYDLLMFYLNGFFSENITNSENDIFGYDDLYWVKMCQFLSHKSVKQSSWKNSKNLIFMKLS